MWKRVFSSKNRCRGKCSNKDQCPSSDTPISIFSLLISEQEEDQRMNGGTNICTASFLSFSVRHWRCSASIRCHFIWTMGGGNRSPSLSKKFLAGTLRKASRKQVFFSEKVLFPPWKWWSGPPMAWEDATQSMAEINLRLMIWSTRFSSPHQKHGHSSDIFHLFSVVIFTDWWTFICFFFLDKYWIEFRFWLKKKRKSTERTCPSDDQALQRSVAQQTMVMWSLAKGWQLPDAPRLTNVEPFELRVRIGEDHRFLKREETFISCHHRRKDGDHALIMETDNRNLINLRQRNFVTIRTRITLHCPTFSCPTCAENAKKCPFRVEELRRKRRTTMEIERVFSPNMIEFGNAWQMNEIFSSFSFISSTVSILKNNINSSVIDQMFVLITIPLRFIRVTDGIICYQCIDSPESFPENYSFISTNSSLASSLLLIFVFRSLRAENGVESRRRKWGELEESRRHPLHLSLHVHPLLFVFIQWKESTKIELSCQKKQIHTSSISNNIYSVSGTTNGLVQREKMGEDRCVALPSHPQCL